MGRSMERGCFETMSATPVENTKTQDAASYDRVSEAYARFTDLTTQALAESVVHLAALQPGDRVLDVGTGTGIVALEAGRRLAAAGGRVAGVDISGGQLAVARRKGQEAGVGSVVQFARCDAESLPFADGSFDVIVSLFALLHFPDPERAVREMFRVLRPQGRLVIGVGAPPSRTTWQGWKHRLNRLPDLVRLARGRLLLAPAMLDRLVGEMLPPQPESEGGASSTAASHSLRREREITALLRQTGFSRIHSQWEGHRTEFADEEEFWQLQSTFSSVARKRLQSAGADEVERLRDQFRSACLAVQARGGTLEYHHAALLASARRAS